MDKIKFYLQQSWLLIIASFVFGLLLAVLNAAWMPRIRQNEIDKFNRLASALFVTDEISAETLTFEAIDEKLKITNAKGKESQLEVKKALVGEKQIGFAFIAEGSGFADKIKIVLAVDSSFEKIRGFGVLFSNETPGFGDKIKNAFYQDQFKNAPAAELTLSKIGDDKIIDDTIVAISGATVSSESVLKIVNLHIEQVKEQLKAKGLIANGK